MSHYHRFWLSLFYVVQEEKSHTVLLLNPPLITCTLENITLVQGSKVWVGTMAIKKKKCEREKIPIKSLSRIFEVFITCIIFNQCTKFSPYSSNSLIEKQHKGREHKLTLRM